MKAGAIRNITVAGSGIMGNAIALLFARRGYPVALYGHREETLRQSRETIAATLESEVLAGELFEVEAQEILARILFTTEQACFTSCDFMMENITEDLAAKHAFYAKVTPLVPPHALLATNTSGLSINAIAEAVQGRSRFMGINWYNPAHLVPLVEITKCDETTEEAAGAAYALMQALGKEPVIVQQDIPGFIGNRMQFAVLREALYLLEQGVASAEDIDRVMKYGLGFRYACLGPLEVADLGGLDTFCRIAEGLNPVLCNQKEASSILRGLYESGAYGVKTGRGFYDYGDGKGEEAIRRRDALFLELSRALYAKEPRCDPKKTDGSECKI